MVSQTTLATTGTALPATEYSDPDEATVHSKGLARKLTCSVVSVVFTGVMLIFFLQLGLILKAVPDWGSGTKENMIELEQQNLEKLSSDKAEYVTEIFERMKEGILQAQAFAEQVLLDKPETMVVENFVQEYAGLDQDEETWEHSVWFVTTLGQDEYPSTGSSLEGLLNRSSLMDVAFRGMQLQHTLMYLASLDDPSAPEGTVSDINMQPYAGFNTEFYLDQTDLMGCDGYDEYGADYRPAAFDPRCRPWYQDAIADDNIDVIFTNPYSDADTYQLSITVAAPVYNRSDPTVLLGVTGIDMDFADIGESILDLTIIGDDPSKDENGYAYLLSPGSEGEVAVHRYIDDYEDDQFITDIEEGIDVDEFDGIISKISSECTGSANYSRDGDMWLLAWGHETASVPGAVGNDNCEGFAVVVTVKKNALLQEFSQMEEDVGKIVAMASGIMAALLVVICICTAAFAVTVSNGIVRPVNQLIDVVHSLYTMDFSKNQVGSWMVNDVSSPEVEELIEAFKAMSTVVKAANMNLRSGNLSVARHNYVNALILFKKLADDRGVAIANNNLGTAHTLQAQERESKAVEVCSQDPVEASRLSDEAKSLYADAITNYKQAIDDAKMLCAAVVKNEEDSTLLHDSFATNQPPEDETKTGLRIAGATYDEHDRSAAAALFLQLSNRKFNLAVCHASRGDSVVPRGPVRNTEAIGQARNLLHECIKLASQSKNDKGEACRVKYLLELASLESRMQRQREAGEALNSAEQILDRYRGDGSEGCAPWTGHREGTPKFSLFVGLPQRFLAARGAHCMACGDVGMAIGSWTRAIIGSGDKMDVAAVESSLKGLRDLAWSGHDVGLLPSELLAALGLPSGRRGDTELLLSAINEALDKVERARDRMVKNRKGMNPEKTSVDLCFIMDCTGSMQKWIDQAKTKLLEIIEQAKADVGDLNLRVGFVGYRDYGDRPQFEGPYDFHTEQQLPDLIAKLKRIKAYGGDDFPEDMAGGLKLASEGLSWESTVRLCILIADAPCHGNMYHSGLGDRFPGGDKNGLDPSKMLYKLKYEHGVDLYFIKITDFTDKMMRVFQTRLANLYAENKSCTKTARPKTDHEIKVHDLGSDDNRFLEAVVESVKSSVHMSHLLIEE